MPLQIDKIYSTLPEEYVKIVVNFEVGYVNDPLDPGGETNIGITIGTLNRAKRRGLVDKNVTIKSLTYRPDVVRIIYDFEFYQRSKSNLLAHPLSFAHFDASINHGVGNSGKFLQRTINKFNKPIIVDGMVGPKTISGLNNTLHCPSLLEFVTVYCNIRESFYHAIVASHPSQNRFLKGWLNRLRHVREYCNVL